jgi:hypothetical protein
MFLKVVAALSLMVLITIAGATEVEVIPHGSPPLLNGIRGENEWMYPAVMDWGLNAVSLSLKQDSQFVYLCVFDRDTSHSGIDLYLDNLAGDIMTLHVSSARGERRKSDTGWSEISFKPPSWWTANVVESIFEEGRMKFLSPPVFEFQIDKLKLPSRTFKLLLHLKRPELWIPSAADTLSSADWIEFELYR